MRKQTCPYPDCDAWLTLEDDAEVWPKHAPLGPGSEVDALGNCALSEFPITAGILYIPESLDFGGAEIDPGLDELVKQMMDHLLSPVDDSDDGPVTALPLVVRGTP